MKNHPCKFGWITWHEWLYLGRTKQIMPKLGPFDPRNDENRTEDRRQKRIYLCYLRREAIRASRGICLLKHLALFMNYIFFWGSIPENIDKYDRPKFYR